MHLSEQENSIEPHHKTYIKHALLLVDDEPGNLRTLERLLSKDYKIVFGDDLAGQFAERGDRNASVSN